MKTEDMSDEEQAIRLLIKEDPEKYIDGVFVRTALAFDFCPDVRLNLVKEDEGIAFRCEKSTGQLEVTFYFAGFVPYDELNNALFTKENS